MPQDLPEIGRPPLPRRITCTITVSEAGPIAVDFAGANVSKAGQLEILHQAAELVRLSR